MKTEQTSALQPLFNDMTLEEAVRYNIQCFQSDPPQSEFAKGMHQMLIDLLPYCGDSHD